MLHHVGQDVPKVLQSFLFRAPGSFLQGFFKLSPTIDRTDYQ